MISLLKEPQRRRGHRGGREDKQKRIVYTVLNVDKNIQINHPWHRHLACEFIRGTGILPVSSSAVILLILSPKIKTRDKCGRSRDIPRYLGDGNL